MLIFLKVFYVLSLLCICRSTPQHLKDLLCLLFPIMHSDSPFQTQSVSTLFPMKACADDSRRAFFCKNTKIRTYYEFALCCKQRLDAFKDTLSRHPGVVLKFKCMPQNTCVTNEDLTHFLTFEMEINNFHTFWCLLLRINKGKLSSSSFNLQQLSNVVTAAALASGKFLLTTWRCHQRDQSPVEKKRGHNLHGETWRHDHRWNWRQIKCPLQKTCAELQLHHYLRVNPCRQWRPPDQWRSGPVEMEN